MTLAHDRSLWEDVAAQLQRTSASHRGNSLSVRDNAAYAEAIAFACCHLVDLRNQYGQIGSDREIIAWAHNVHSMDVALVGSLLSDALVVLRNVHQPVSVTWFKRQVGYTAHLGRVLSPARWVIADFCENPTARSFAICSQFLSFLTHLSLQDLTLDLEEEYLDLEASLRDYTVPVSLTDRMEPIMREWMEGCLVTRDNFHPRHGNGATAETVRGAHVSEKYRAFGYDADLVCSFCRHADIDVLSYFCYPAQSLSRVSEVVFVPKSMKTRRTISKEPAILQFLQQGLRDVMYSYIAAHPYLSTHINFERQEYNGQLALRGSRDHRFATIDLSSASDRVTFEIVERLFHNTPIWPFLRCTRSTTAVLPSGVEIGLRKFAPMGSALCFPIQTLVFACAVEYTVRRAQTTLLGNYPTWRVYGDDIIVEDDVYDDVILVLETLGFVVNRSKSFCSPTRFRESCGVEGFDGVDVTPVKISRGYQSPGIRMTSRHASLHSGLVDFANTCKVHRFPLLRSAVIQILLERHPVPPLFSLEGEGAVMSDWPDNYRARRRWNQDLQRFDITIARTEVRIETASYPDSYEHGRLHETLRLIENRSGDMFLPEHRVVVPRGTEQSILGHVAIMPPFWGVRTT